MLQVKAAKRHRGRVGHARHSGFASILALIILVVFASLGIAFTNFTALNVSKADNFRGAGNARLAAESGLEYLGYVIKSFDLPSDVSGQDLRDALASSLQSELNSTANLGSATVTYDGNTITVPFISFGNSSSFRADLTMPDSTTIKLTVVGRHTSSGESIERSMSMVFNSGSKAGNIKYGIFSKGPITIGQNLNFIGANSPEEASIYTEAEVVGAVITVTSGYIAGNVDVKDPNGSVSIGAAVNGTITIGAPPAEMPTIDPSVFEPFATYIVDSNTPTSNVTLTNARILADTNPVFGNNVTIQGVLYIEAPNYVYFNNNPNVTGVIVTEDPGSGASPSTHKIYFKNNLSMVGVEQLPDAPEFTALKLLSGSAILAPGFALEFKNNFGTIGGTIVCESMVVKNNLNATIMGSLIIYGDAGLDLKNNSNITMDRSNLIGPPAGITVPSPTILTADPDTYLEL